MNQSVTGDVIGGTGMTPTIAFGNFHLGDRRDQELRDQRRRRHWPFPARRGPDQRQRGGNLTDNRLSGSGVTAVNWGPLSPDTSTGNCTVTFNPFLAGALNGQVLHLLDNFDNIQDQNLSITGAVFRLATASAHSPEPATLPNQYVGGSARRRSA